MSLERAVNSVLKQDLPKDLEIELIVVDDGSFDNTAQTMESYKDRLTYLFQNNRGVSAARNRGIKAARGQWIALLDSDDEWMPNKIIRQFEILDSSLLKVCHTEEIWIRKGVRVNQKEKHQKRGGRIFLECLPLCAMSPSSIIIHRSVLESVGTFDESLPACEDYDLWLKISARYEVAFVSKPCLIKYGGHVDQLSRQHWGMDRFRVQSLEGILSDETARALSPEEHQAAINMLISKLRILLNGAKKRNNQKFEKSIQEKLDKWLPHGS